MTTRRPRRRGAPPQRTPAVRDRVVRAVAAGHYPEAAAAWRLERRHSGR
jgi:hypothetical protein